MILNSKLLTFVNVGNKKSITIRQFQRLTKLESIKGLSDGLEKKILTASIVSGVPVKELRAKPLLELTTFIDKVVDSYDFEFKDKNHNKSIVIDHKKYYIISEVHKITSGQMMDLGEFIKGEDDVIDNLHFIVAILLRENKKEYDGETLLARADVMREHCPYNDIYDIAVFFCKVLSKLPSLLEQEMEKSLRSMSNDGDGSFI